VEVNRFITTDCLPWMRDQEENSVDLTVGSPPYEDARLYGMGFKLLGQEWVDWMVPIVLEAVRITRGPVMFVVEGRTRKFRWSATPALLMADLHRAGVHLRKPPAFCRNGIPGSGGPDWLRNDYEFIVCCTSGGKLPWSDNTAMGRPPKYETGGRCSNRTADGRRAKGNGGYAKPRISNPGNVIHCKVGGGNMGSQLAHENEAPFPETLAEFFIQSFCPPGGIVLDPFSGSATTPAVAERCGRQWIGLDIRQSQTDLGQMRITELTTEES